MRGTLAPIPLRYRVKKPPGCCRLLGNHPYLGKYGKDPSGLTIIFPLRVARGERLLVRAKECAFQGTPQGYPSDLMRLSGYPAELPKRLDCCRPPVFATGPPKGASWAVSLAGYPAGLPKRLGWLATRVPRRATRANEIDAPGHPAGSRAANHKSPLVTP